MYVCVYVCMYVYIYIHLSIYRVDNNHFNNLRFDNSLETTNNA